MPSFLVCKGDGLSYTVPGPDFSQTLRFLPLQLWFSRPGNAAGESTATNTPPGPVRLPRLLADAPSVPGTRSNSHTTLPAFLSKPHRHGLLASAHAVPLSSLPTLQTPIHPLGPSRYLEHTYTLCQALR